MSRTPGRVRRARTSLAVLVVATLAVTLVACSGSSDDGDESPATAAASDVSVTCPATVAPAAVSQRVDLVTPEGPRHYFVSTPAGYDGTTAVPLVVDYHGLGGEALRYSTTFSGVGRDAAARGYLYVAPQDNGLGTWGAPGYVLGADDVAFTRQLVGELSATYCVDPMRVYATGFSLGSGFTHHVTCSLDVFAAAAPLGGVNLVRPCPDAPPVPVVAWHGTADPTVPYGLDTVTSEPPAVEGESYVGNVGWVMDGWATRNGCTTTRVDTAVDADVVRRTYEGCPGGQEVVLYVHTGGHTYPGGPPLDAEGVAMRGEQVMSIDAGKEILDFFDAHVRTSPPAAAAGVAPASSVPASSVPAASPAP